MDLERSWKGLGTTGQIVTIGGAALLGAIVGITALNVLPGALVLIFGVLIFVGIGIYLYMMLAGNKAEVCATPAQRLHALSTGPGPGAAKAIFYREGFVGRLLSVQLTLDGQPMVALKSPRFAAVDVTPGTHTLAAGAGGFAASQVNAGTVTFTVEPGQIIAFRLEILLGALKNTVIVIPDPMIQILPSRLATVDMVLAGVPPVAPQTAAV